MARVELQIDELVLHGLDAGDGFAVARGIEHELTRLLMERGSPALQPGGDVPRIDAGTIDLLPEAPRAFGGRVAEAVYGSMAP